MRRFLNFSDIKPKSMQDEIAEESDKKILEQVHVNEKASVSECSEQIDEILQKKEYHHWNSKKEQEINRNKIRDYDQKKRAVDKASLQTQRSTLTKYSRCFEPNNLQRMYSELDSNKIEIYNEPYFVSEKVTGLGPYHVVGIRDFPDGKICVRDTDDLNRLRHTSTHETMHDLSYHSESHETKTERNDDESISTYSKTDFMSGIHKVEKTEKITEGNVEGTDIKHSNRYLNEGLTELYAIEEMTERGELSNFDCYSQEVGWALNLREVVGEEAVAKAYFGGNVDDLREKVNGMSSIPDAWEVLNYNIDAYHCTGNFKYKFAADDIIDNLHGGKVLVKRRA